VRNAISPPISAAVAWSPTFTCITGIDLAKQIALAADGPKVILITGHPEETWRARALNAGAAGFLRKPIESKSLLDLVEQSVGT
jgi:FixJ family two-component response regulator